GAAPPPRLGLADPRRNAAGAPRGSGHAGRLGPARRGRRVAGGGRCRRARARRRGRMSDRAESGSQRRPPPPEGPGAGATAARVLRRVVALTFTEAAAAEMAGRAARELMALGRGARAEWLAAAGLPPVPEAARRARALLAALDHLAVETIHAWCFRLLAAH